MNNQFKSNPTQDNSNTYTTYNVPDPFFTSARAKDLSKRTAEAGGEFSNLCTIDRLAGTAGTIFRQSHLGNEFKVVKTNVKTSPVTIALNGYLNHAKAAGVHFQEALSCFRDLGGAKNFTHTGADHRIGTTHYSLNANTGVIESPFFNLNSKQLVINSAYFHTVSDLYQHSSKYIWHRAERHYQLLAGTMSHVVGSAENFYQNYNQITYNHNLAAYKFNLQVGNPNGFVDDWTDTNVSALGNPIEVTQLKSVYSNKDLQQFAQSVGGVTQLKEKIAQVGGSANLNRLVTGLGGKVNLTQITDRIGSWDTLSKLTGKLDKAELIKFLPKDSKLDPLKTLIDNTSPENLDKTFTDLGKVSQLHKAAESISPIVGEMKIAAEKNLTLTSSQKAIVAASNVDLLSKNSSSICSKKLEISASNNISIHSNNTTTIQAGNNLKITSNLVLINCTGFVPVRVKQPTAPTSEKLPVIPLPDDYQRTPVIQTTKAGVVNYGKESYLQPALGTSGVRVAANSTPTDIYTPPKSSPAFLPVENDYK